MRRPQIAVSALAVLILALVAAGCRDDRPSYATVTTADDASMPDASGENNASNNNGTSPDDVGSEPDAEDPEDDTGQIQPVDTGEDPPDLPELLDVTVEDVQPDLPAPDCFTLAERECIATEGCVLEQSLDDLSYFCRPARDVCEHESIPEACEGLEGCEYFPGACYCPTDELCACGGGPPPQCRALGAAFGCRADNAEICGERICCADEGETRGVCREREICEAGSGCGPLVELRVTGGLCEGGVCETIVRVHDQGYLFVDGYRGTPGSPVDGDLSPAAWDTVRDTLTALSATPPESAYGECCNAATDGSDQYLTIYEDGYPVQFVRVSNAQGLPEPLARLIATLLEASRTLAESPEPAVAACSGLPAVPSVDGGAPSCENFYDYASAGFQFQILGPNAQIDAGTLDLHPDLWDGQWPLELELNGTVSAVGDGQGVDIMVGEERWSLNALATPGIIVPRLCEVVGHEVSLSVRVVEAFGFYNLGVMIRDARGVLFVADNGLAGIDQNDASPFRVEITDGGGCAPISEDMGCEREVARGLRFEVGADSFELLTGSWGHVRTSVGYDLAVFNLKSYQTGICDDYWNYAYAAYAITGSDRKLCAP